MRVAKSLVTSWLPAPIDALFNINLMIVLLHLLMQVSLLVINDLFQVGLHIAYALDHGL